MKKIVLLFLIISCSAKRESLLINNCNKKNATKIASQALTSAGYDVSLLKKQIEETDGFYIINYSPVDTLVRGNAAMVKIDKLNCEIIEGNLQQ